MADHIHWCFFMTKRRALGDFTWEAGLSTWHRPQSLSCSAALLTIALLSVFGCSRLPAPTAQSVSTAIQEGDDHFEKQKWDEAIIAYTTAIQRKDGIETAYYKRASARVKTGDMQLASEDFHVAISLYDAVIASNPQDFEAYRRRGYSHKSLGHSSEALADYNRAIEIAPAFIKALRNRGEILMTLNRFNEALRDFDIVVSSGQQDSYIFSARGLCRAKLGYLKQAIEDYDRAIQLAPAKASNYFNRGCVFSDLGDSDRALRDYTTAIRIDSKPRYLVSRGKSYASIGREQDAIFDFERAIQSDDKNVEAYSCRGALLANANELQRAFADFNHAIQLNPKHVDAYTGRAAVHLKRGHWAAAEADCLYAANLAPNDSVSVRLLGEMYYSKKEFVAAVKFQTRAIALNPVTPRAHLCRAVAYYELGKRDEALADAVRESELFPNDEEAKELLAELRSAKTNINSRLKRQEIDRVGEFVTGIVIAALIAALKQDANYDRSGAAICPPWLSTDSSYFQLRPMQTGAPSNFSRAAPMSFSRQLTLSQVDSGSYRVELGASSVWNGTRNVDGGFDFMANSGATVRTSPNVEGGFNIEGPSGIRWTTMPNPEGGFDLSGGGGERFQATPNVEGGYDIKSGTFLRQWRAVPNPEGGLDILNY